MLDLSGLSIESSKPSRKQSGKPLRKENLNSFLKSFAQEHRIDIQNPDLFFLAFTHRSMSKKKNHVNNNERLEFLGDSIINTCISHILYTRYPYAREGILSRAKSFFVSTRSLADIAKRMDLGKLLIMSKSAEKSGARNNDNILASTLEAFIGAIYLTVGFDRTLEIIESIFKKSFDKIDNLADLTDYKSKLQEYAQQNHSTRPVYSIVKESGPDHRKVFTVKVEISGREYGSGTGHTKKEAQQEAAKAALLNIVGKENG